MPPRPGILDGLSRSDELLVDIAKTLENLHAHLSREEERETRIVYFAYPNDGTLATLQAGTTTLDFKVGTIEDVDNVITRMSHSLQSEGRNWLRSFFVNSDKSITVQPDGYDKIPATEEKDALGTYQEFTKLKITCIGETNVFVACCTSPEAVVRLISNAAVLTDPVDVFGNRTYIGAGELAVRLGSIKSYDKRGEVVFMDNFEDSTLKWILSGEAAPAPGYSVKRSIDYASTGNYSLKMIAPPGSMGIATITRYWKPPVEGKAGLEATFTISERSVTVKMFMIYYTGTYQHYVKIAMRQWNPDIYYIDSNGNYITKAYPRVFEVGDTVFHTMKLTVDFSTEKFVGLFVDNEFFDMTGISYYKVADTSVNPVIQIAIQIQNIGGGGIFRHTYLDNVIYTQNEP